MAGLEHRHAHPRQADRRGAGNHRPAVARGQCRLHRHALSPDRRVDLAQAGPARPADVDRRWLGRGDPPNPALRAGAGKGGGRPPPDAGRIVAAIKAAAREAGRSIDEDHYGASFPFYFGDAGDSVVVNAMAAYGKRTGRDPSRYFAIGDEKAMLERVAEYVAGGVEKFIL